MKTITILLFLIPLISFTQSKVFVLRAQNNQITYAQGYDKNTGKKWEFTGDSVVYQGDLDGKPVEIIYPNSSSSNTNSLYSDNLPRADENLYRDDCGQWWRRQKRCSPWIKNPIEIREATHHNFQLHADILDPCWKPNSYTEIEYRLEPEGKIEWSREVVVTYIKL